MQENCINKEAHKQSRPALMERHWTGYLFNNYDRKTPKSFAKLDLFLGCDIQRCLCCL